MLGTGACGVYGGYFGAAQGILLLGILAFALHDELQRLNALKVVLAGIANLVAGIVFAFAAHVDWLVAGLIALGSLLGGIIGARARPAPVAVGAAGGDSGGRRERDHPAAVSRSARRFGLIASAYAFAITMVGTTLPTPLYVLYRERFGFSELMITVIFATYAAGVIAALLLFGALSDEIGRRRVLLPGLALSALSAVAFLLAQGLVPLLVGRALSGLSAGIFTGTATATIIDFADPARRGRATLVATMANMGGLGCGPLLAGILAQSAGAKLRLSYWVDLGLLVPAAVGLLAMREPVENARGRPSKLRPQTFTVPDEIRATFIRAALAGFAGFAVLGPFHRGLACVPRSGAARQEPRHGRRRGVRGIRGLGSRPAVAREDRRANCAPARLRDPDRRDGAARRRDRRRLAGICWSPAAW